MVEKVYDTDTADLVSEWDNSLPLSDFKHCKELLYRTIRGRFFLVGEGGGLTQYARNTGNGYTTGRQLSAMTDGQAVQWLEDHNDVAAMEEYFGAEIEDA